MPRWPFGSRTTNRRLMPPENADTMTTHTPSPWQLTIQTPGGRIVSYYQTLAAARDVADAYDALGYGTTLEWSVPKTDLDRAMNANPARELFR